MKKLITALGILMWLSCLASAQTTTVSAIVTDSDGTVWANGTWSMVYIPSPSYPNLNIYTCNGSALTSSYNGSMNGSGAFSQAVCSSASITPAGGTWSILVCPNASSTCSTIYFIAVGSTTNLSTALTAAIVAPRFVAVAGAFGYADVEASLQLKPGSTYWNVISACQKYYNISWACGSGGGGGDVTHTLGALAPNAIMTGNGGGDSQTPNSSATVDTSGNMVLPGSATLGAGTPSLFNITPMTVAQLQALVSPAPNDQHEVSDAVDSQDCTTGLASTTHWCYWSSSAWLSATPPVPLIKTSGTNNASQAAVNFIPSTTDSTGLHLTPSNPATTSEKLEITGPLLATALPVVPTIVSSGAISTLAVPAGVAVCTTTCNVTFPTPAAGNQFCVRNAPGSATVITLNALGSAKYYELTDHSAWGTANHTVVSGGAASDSICLVGYDASHYMVASSTGTWTD